MEKQTNIILSQKVKHICNKGLYVGTELGTCSYLQFMDFYYTRTDASFSATDKYSAWYKQEQVYATFNTQYRFEDFSVPKRGKY